MPALSPSKIVFLVVLLFSVPSSAAAQGTAIDSVVEATSLLGEKLIRPVPTGQTRTDHEVRLGQAMRAFTAAPNDVDSIIWFGRRLAYLGRYNDAIAVYTEGIEKNHYEPRLLRHRGHRYITVRKLDPAITDLWRAYDLAKSIPDQIEPDGLPNARNIPTSSLKSNIRYHLALVYYLKGEFSQAAKFWQEDVDSASNPDMLVASSHWLYMSLRRLGKHADAQMVLRRISKDMDIIENTAYHRLLLMYKGELKPEALLPDSAKGTLENVTTAYGVANWHLYNGRTADADKIFEQILATKSQWASFGYLAAEAELARRKRGSGTR